MDTSKLKNYLFETIDCETDLIPADTTGMPGFISRTFSPFCGSIFSRQVYFLFVPDNYFRQFTIHDINGVVTALKRFNAALTVVFIFEKISRQERKALVRQKISFVVPCQQLFLPYLGVAFSEHIRETASTLSPTLTPVSQVMILHQLLFRNIDGLTAPKIGDLLGYATMSASRAMEQVQELGLARIDFDGYRKTVHFETDLQTLWQKAMPLMRSPVKKIVGILKDDALATYPLAGEYALSKNSSLFSERKCFAVRDTEFNSMLRSGKISVAKSPEIGVADIQVWTYQPIDITGIVDTFSLELSFNNTRDARILNSILELKESRKW